MIIMYFSHHFPLTSHIRGHMLSTQMALLHPSANNSLCWYTKGHFRIEVFLNNINGHDMRCIYPSTSLPFYFSMCWFPYMTISTETRVHTRLRLLTTRILYTTIPIATHIQIYMRVSLIATHVSYAGFLYQWSCIHPFDIKNNKTWLMEIFLSLIINYLNCLNLLNLWNLPISQSINRGLGEGINESYL